MGVPPIQMPVIIYNFFSYLQSCGLYENLICSSIYIYKPQSYTIQYRGQYKYEYLFISYLTCIGLSFVAILAPTLFKGITSDNSDSSHKPHFTGLTRTVVVGTT